MIKFSIGKFVPEILRQNADKRLTARELAQLIMAAYPESVEDKRLRSRASKLPLDTHDAMLQQIVAEIGAQRKALEAKNPEIRTTEGRPRKYYYSERSDDEISQDPISEDVVVETGQKTEIEEVSTTYEADLYPLLIEYLSKELGVYGKRIDERRSSNARGKGGNKWLYPDVVGMEDLSKNWNREVIDCAKEYSDKKTKLWSFEVKLRLNRSNIREAYFQAVSNSSWSNLGYLVSAEIEGTDTLDELRMLSGVHGIGLIKLEPEDISEGQLLIPARERTEVDWGSINRLAQENSDFLEYIRLIRQFYQTGDPRKRDWV